MKKFNGNIKNKIIIIFLLAISCNSNNEEHLNTYYFLNNYYLPLIDRDTFPRNIYEKVLSIKYWESDTIIINGIEFNNHGDHMNGYFDNSVKWNFDSLIKCRKIDSIEITSCPSNNSDSFKTKFGKGYITISEPLISGNFLLIKEYKRRSNLSESYDNETNYLVFEKVNNNWNLKIKKTIEILY